MIYNVVTLLVSVASLVVSLVAAVLAGHSLDQAKRVADRDSADWKQRKWFELYFEAERAYDALDQIQSQYADGAPSQDSAEWNKYATQVNSLMLMMRRVHSMAAVIPVLPEVTMLFLNTVFPNENDLLSADRKSSLFNAVEGIRQKALIKNLEIFGD